MPLPPRRANASGTSSLEHSRGSRQLPEESAVPPPERPAPSKALGPDQAYILGDAGLLEGIPCESQGQVPTSPRSSLETETCSGECYHLRTVLVHRLLEDGTLGLLLNGTTIVGFCNPQVEEAGWAINDQIVEVNGQRVAFFEEFIEHFKAAQEQGYPISFGVLRRELADPSEGDGAEDALESFFSVNNIVDLAGQLQRKFGASYAPYENMTPSSAATADGRDGQFFADGSCPSHRSSSITDNPYIQALRNRRDELLRSVEGWSTEVAESLASRLATERSDALATLVKPQQEAPRGLFAVGAQEALCRGGEQLLDLPMPLAWTSCIGTGARPCSSSQAGACAGYEIQPTPRVDLLETEDLSEEGSSADPGRLEPVKTWAGFESPGKDGRWPRGFAPGSTR